MIVGLLKFILIFFLVLYVLGFIGRISLRYWLAKKQREFQQNGGAPGGGFFYKQYTWGGNQRPQEQQQKEGEVKISNANTANDKKISREVGDYVEYEEVKSSDK